MSIEFVATDERGVGTADKRRSTQIPGLFYPRQSEFIRGSSSRLPYPRIWGVAHSRIKRTRTAEQVFPGQPDAEDIPWRTIAGWLAVLLFVLLGTLVAVVLMGGH